MTYRERRQRRAERLREWAPKHAAKAEAASDSAHALLDPIPLGQPILVGHHSEKRHRRTLARADAAMHKSVEESKTAARMESKADEIERQLARAIYDDDPDALEQLQGRLEALTAKRERMNRCNRLYRKGDAEGLAAEGLDLEQLRQEIARRYTWEQKGPFRPYELSNLGGQITKTRDRIRAVTQRRGEEAKTEAAGGVLVERHTEQNWCSVRFADYPGREIVHALKAAGYGWGGGRWSGYLDKLPEIVTKAEAAAKGTP